ncbi:hypothetical protein [Salinicola avicenniae]|uniref:hypothetical protein n=1 Tax=Salinicola avicenniae TaxID=2916836 RepID=UPI0020749037|nr:MULTISPECIES: hypothetical protein [unclassified Salinicola]
MRKPLIAASLTALMLGLATSAMAQSEAMEEAYDANNEPLAEGSGVTATGTTDSDTGAGQSAATAESLDAVESETNGLTDIENAEALDEVNADGQSAAAGEALENQ